MSRRDSQPGWIIVFPGLVFLVWLLFLASVSLRGAGRAKSWLGIHGSGREQRSGGIDEWEAGPAGLDDPRLSSLRRAAESWRRSAKVERLVVDQVCLVPDVPAFLEAIAAWDEHHFFPILIDEPAWVLPFLRAFRPARVVRYPRPAAASDPSALPQWPGPPRSREAEWSSALKAVAWACSGQDPSPAELPSNGTPGGERKPQSAGIGAVCAGEPDARRRRRIGGGALPKARTPGTKRDLWRGETRASIRRLAHHDGGLGFRTPGRGASRRRGRLLRAAWRRLRFPDPGRGLAVPILERSRRWPHGWIFRARRSDRPQAPGWAE